MAKTVKIVKKRGQPDVVTVNRGGRMPEAPDTQAPAATEPRPAKDKRVKLPVLRITPKFRKLLR